MSRRSGRSLDVLDREGPVWPEELDGAHSSPFAGVTQSRFDGSALGSALSAPRQGRPGWVGLTRYRPSGLVNASTYQWAHRRGRGSDTSAPACHASRR
jgi:hypothetical protein